MQMGRLAIAVRPLLPGRAARSSGRARQPGLGTAPASTRLQGKPAPIQDPSRRHRSGFVLAIRWRCTNLWAPVTSPVASPSSFLSGAARQFRRIG